MKLYTFHQSGSAYRVRIAHLTPKRVREQLAQYREIVHFTIEIHQCG